ERLHEGASVRLGHRNHIEDDIRGEAPQLGGGFVEAAAVAVEVADRWWQLRLRPPAVKHGDFMARRGQLPDCVRAHEVRAADDDDSHVAATWSTFGRR